MFALEATYDCEECDNLAGTYEVPLKTLCGWEQTFTLSSCTMDANPCLGGGGLTLTPRLTITVGLSGPLSSTVVEASVRMWFAEEIVDGVSCKDAYQEFDYDTGSEYCSGSHTLTRTGTSIEDLCEEGATSTITVEL